MNRLLQLLIWIIFCICIYLTFITIFRGIIFNDEGYIIYSAKRLLDGQIMYRDFHFAYTPGSAFFSALIFFVFGHSLYAARVGTFILTIITSLILYVIGRKITKEKIYILLPILGFLAWGPTHINFSWPVMYSIPIGFAVCLCIINAIETKRSIYLFAAGCLTTTLFLFKQNFGFGVAVMCFAFIIFQRSLRTRSLIFFYTAGLLMISAIFIAYLFITNSFYPFLQDMYVYTVQRIIFERALDTPFFYGKTIIAIACKAILYLFPFYMSLLSFLVLIRKKRANDNFLIILSVFCGLFYLLGIRPTTDYVHLAPLLAVSGLPLLILFSNIKQALSRSIIVFIFIFYISAGFYTGLFFGYYRWQEPVLLQTRYLDEARTGIWVSKKNNAEVRKIDKIVSAYAPKDTYIFVNDYQPMIYFLTGKQNPTKFDLLAHNQYFLTEMPQVTKILQKKNVKLIITNKDFYNDITFLAKYIRKNYHRVGESENFYFWYMSG